MITTAEWAYREVSNAPGHSFLVPGIRRVAELTAGTRVLDVGSGKGQLAGELARAGCVVVGVDPSRSGVELARRDHPGVRFEVMEASEDLLGALGERAFDVVLAIEVIEHTYDPGAFVRACYECVTPGGLFVCSTPYHGYFKNLAIALLGRFDDHVNPLWLGGHIKFWSKATLTKLLTEAGFQDLRFLGVGRAPLLWKSMIVSGRVPAAPKLRAA